MLSASQLSSPKARHAFFTRHGGVSHGLYDSLNCGLGSGDDADAVMENRRRAATHFGLASDRLVTLYQIHSPTVMTVTKPWPTDQRPKADGLVTREKNLILGVLTADCAPVLFLDESAGVIGAAHAGWKGALGGVLEATQAAMLALGASPANIRAAVGPTIAQASYEVSVGFEQPFLQHADDSERFFRPGRPGKLHFDLPGYCAWRLAGAGIRQVEILSADTCAEHQRFFSYRRATLKGERDYGRLLSAIALT